MIQHNDVGEFKFDHVFQPQVSNQEVYDKVVKNSIDQLMDGFNATVFAYGMTGSGKTYSMSGTREEPGVIPLSINEIFNRIDNSDKNTFNYEIKCSYLEIYNERIFDLLNIDQFNNPQNSIGNNINNSAELKIRDVPNFGVKVIGLVEESVSNRSELLSLINKGDQNRRTGETDFNTRSSRSHAIILIRIKIINTLTSLETFSTLSLCDLAGSERATGQTERRKEGSFINKSLLALGSVIVKLSSPSSSVGHIPYRDSKLTRILQPALSGDSIVSILCTIHTSANALAETVNTVRFAARAKNINLTVKKNEIDITNEKDRIIEKLKQKINEQQDEIVALKSSNNNNSNNSGKSGSSSMVEDDNNEVQQLSAENRILIERLEHFKRLNDESFAEKMVLKNDIINDIFQKSTETNDFSSISDSIILKVEQLFKKTFAEIDEYKSYINHLETQLKLELQKSQGESQSLNRTSSSSPSKSANSNEVDLILREQEDEIFDLKSQLKNKEKIIKALQSAKRVRESLINTININDSRRESGAFETLKPLKESERLNHLNLKS